MRTKILTAIMLATPLFVAAQTADDPTLMTINGQAVPRSEFEYSYNKNNTDGVIDKKTVEEYAELFINYKLKVAAALDEHYDTLTSFKKEFAQYRDQQITPTFVSDADVEAKAEEIYRQTKDNIGERGLIRPAHILLLVSARATAGQRDSVKMRIDSIYNVLTHGGDFAELAKKYSEDRGSKQNGGELPWLAQNQTLKEFEDNAFALQPGEMSKPFLSPVGYHIVLMKERKQLEPYDSLRPNIMRFIEARHIREAIAKANIDTIAAHSNGTLTADQVVAQRRDSLSANNLELKYLIQEYHDGLLLYEIANRRVWGKASKDEAGLKAWFEKHKKDYAWAEPRFKGIAYHVKDAADVKAVRNCVKRLPYDQWNEALRKTFNADSVLRIRAEKGIFKKGDNALIDREVFKVAGREVKPTKDFPIDATYGKLLKKGPEDYTDVKSQVTADYQKALETQWVAELRQQYKVTVDADVLKTVNNHKK